MSLEHHIIIFLFSILLILLCFQFFFSNSGSSEKLKFLLERQENLEKSLLEMIEKNFNVIDSNFKIRETQSVNNIGDKNVPRVIANFSYKTNINEKHLNRVKITHGGYIASIIDAGSGTAASRYAGNIPCVTISLDLKYIGASKIGD